MPGKNLQHLGENLGAKLRRALNLYPPYANFAAFERQRMIQRHADSLPVLPIGRQRAVDTLREEGAVESSAGIFDLPGAQAMLADCALMLDRWAGTTGILPCGGQASHPHVSLIEAFPQIYAWGVNDHLLDMMEHAVGLPPLYLGYDLKCEFANDFTGGVRMWHCDVEDRHVAKLLIYLDVVNDANGPFCWIPASASHRLRRQIHYVRGYVPDAVVGRRLPEDLQRFAVGAAGHAVLFDGACVFHRASVPRDSHRLSITFSYSSRRPLRIFSPGPTPTLRSKLVPLLSPRQRECLIG